MSDSNSTAQVPRPFPLSANQTVAYEGLLFKKDSGNSYTINAAVTDTPSIVSDQAWVDAEQTARTAAAGDRGLLGYPLGCGKIVMVKSVADTYTAFCKVYGSQTADANGYCSVDSSNSAVCIGHYIGEGEATTAGDLIPVILDTPSTQ